jgi:Protein of unknown function (DUF1638)
VNRDMNDAFDAASPATRRTLLIACGALAHEIVALKTLHQWQHLDVQCLPAELHNRPEKIPAEVLALIAAHRERYQRMYVVYADCGTGGALDRVLEEEHVERIGGAHCYEFYAGAAAFAKLHDDEPGTFYLTDFLLRHFDRLVIRALGLDRHPELRNTTGGSCSWRSWRRRKQQWRRRAPPPSASGSRSKCGTRATVNSRAG